MVFHPADLHKKRSRRLRKKLHLGEFQEFGLTLAFTFDPQQTDFEEALDRWIEFVESQEWGFGGGSDMAGSVIEGYLCRFERGTLTEADRGQAGKWLASQPWVVSHQIPPLSDAWYGTWEDESTTVLSDPYKKETPMSDDKIYFPNEVIGLQFVQGLSLLAAWRNYRGLSQTDLAERVDISMSELVAMEQPDYQFTHQQLVLLADALGIQHEHLTD
ncbi:50S ribosome-binding protein YggL [Aeromonas allosaccharophila]